MGGFNEGWKEIVAYYLGLVDEYSQWSESGSQPNHHHHHSPSPSSIITIIIIIIRARIRSEKGSLKDP